MSLIQTSTCLKRQVKKHSWPPTIFGIWISDLLRQITGPVHDLEHLELQSIWCVSMELWNPEEMNSDRASTASVKARMEAGSPDRLNRKHSGAADSPVLVFSPNEARRDQYTDCTVWKRGSVLLLTQTCIVIEHVMLWISQYNWSFTPWLFL